MPLDAGQEDCRRGMHDQSCCTLSGFFLLMTGGNIKTVYAQMSSQTHHKDIEDYSLIVLRTDQGAVGVVETGYTFLKRSGEQREACFSFRSGKNYYRISQEEARVISSVDGAPEGHD